MIGIYKITKIEYLFKPYNKFFEEDIILIYQFIRKKKNNELTMNLYRLSLKPYGQGSRAAIGTQFEMVSSLNESKR